MAPVLGRPFLEWVLRWIATGGISKCLLSTGFLSEKIETHFRLNPLTGLHISCVPEADPLGTAGGFLNCVAAVPSAAEDDVWLVTNGDSMAITGLRDLLTRMSDPKVDAAVLGLQVPDASRYGTLAIGDDGRLLEFAEKRPGAGVINAGVYLFRHRTLAHFPAQRPLSFETEVFPTLLHNVHVTTLTVDAPFLDIGTPQSLAEAESFISQNQPFFTS